MHQYDELGRIAKECYLTPESFRRNENGSSTDDDDVSSPWHSKWKIVFSGAILIVGRGSYQDDEQFGNSEIICLDRFGGAFKNPSQQHLWLDFNLPKALQLLPIHSLSQIIVDYSTWRYLNVSKMMNTWMQLLERNGRLVFEGGIASYKLIPKVSESPPTCNENYEKVGDWYFENHNPCHPVLTIDDLKNLIGARIPAMQMDFSMKSLPRKTNIIRFNERIIIPASSSFKRADTNSLSTLLSEDGFHSKKSNMLSIEKNEFGSFLKTITASLLFNSYQDLFKGYMCNAFSDRYPIATSRPVSDWIEVKKRHLD